MWSNTCMSWATTPQLKTPRPRVERFRDRKAGCSPCWNVNKKIWAHGFPKLEKVWRNLETRCDVDRKPLVTSLGQDTAYCLLEKNEMACDRRREQEETTAIHWCRMLVWSADPRSEFIDGLWSFWLERDWLKKITPLKDRITPHVTNFFRLRLVIEKQEGKRKYKSDGAVMVGEFVCMYVCSCTVSEWECEWVMWVWCVWARDVRVSEVSEVKWVSGWVREGVSECVWVSECEWVSESEWVSGWVSEWVRVSEWEWVSVCVCAVCYALCVVRCVLCVVCYVLWERRDVSLGRKVVVDLHGLPLMSPPPANVVSARPKPNRSVRTKASTSVLKQVGTYLHMYCTRLSQLREHLSTCRPIMKQDWRWTCSFPPSPMPGAQPTGKKVPSSLLLERKCV